MLAKSLVLCFGHNPKMEERDDTFFWKAYENVVFMFFPSVQCIHSQY